MAIMTMHGHIKATIMVEAMIQLITTNSSTLTNLTTTKTQSPSSPISDNFSWHDLCFK